MPETYPRTMRMVHGRAYGTQSFVSGSSGSSSSKPWKHNLSSPFSHLLDKNISLPPYHRQDLDSVITEAEDTLQILDSTMDNLRAFLAHQESHRGELEAFIDRHRQLAERTPIANSNFPPELLLTVFGYLLEEDQEAPDRLDSLHPLHPIWAVSQVCTLWRRIARSSPSLWASVCVGAFVRGYGAAARAAKLDERRCRLGAQIGLAKTHPLSIRIVEPNSSQELLPYLRPIIHLLLLSRARFRHLSITVPQNSTLMSSVESLQDPSLPEQTFPLLESLEYNVIQSVIALPPPPLNYLPWSFGQLKELTLSGFSSFNDEWPVGITVPWHNLEILSMSNCDTTWLPAVISEMTSLQSLSLQLKEANPDADADPLAAPQHYHLPSLYTLEITYPKRPPPPIDGMATPPIPKYLPPWPSWLVAIDAPQLSRLSESCLWIDRDGTVMTPRVPPTDSLGFLDYLTRVGTSLTHFHCEEFYCDVEEDECPTFVVLLQQMSALKSLSIRLNMTGTSAWAHYALSSNPYVPSPKHLFRALALDPEEGLLPELEHLRITLKVDGLRSVGAVSGLLDVLECRWGQGKLKEVDLVFVRSPAFAIDFAPSDAARVKDLVGRGLIIRSTCVSDERPCGFMRRNV